MKKLNCKVINPFHLGEEPNRAVISPESHPEGIVLEEETASRYRKAGCLEILGEFEEKKESKAEKAAREKAEKEAADQAAKDKKDAEDAELARLEAEENAQKAKNSSQNNNQGHENSAQK